jgi:hypothetical protein
MCIQMSLAPSRPKQFNSAQLQNNVVGSFLDLTGAGAQNSVNACRGDVSTVENDFLTARITSEWRAAWKYYGSYSRTSYSR